MAQLRWQHDIGAVIAAQVWDPGGLRAVKDAKSGFYSWEAVRPSVVLLVQDLHSCQADGKNVVCVKWKHSVGSRVFRCNEPMRLQFKCVYIHVWCPLFMLVYFLAMCIDKDHTILVII